MAVDRQPNMRDMSDVPVLVVDDNATKRFAITAALTPLGYSIVEATGSFYGALAFIGVLALVGAASYIFIVGDVHRVEIESL